MRLAEGDMWSAYDQADLFLVTTNSVLNRYGALVMGAGIARQARERFPELDAALGNAVVQVGDTYGLIVSPRWPTAKLGGFQTKVRWHDPSSLELINFSASKLVAWCKAHPTARVHLNMPGVGHGRLSREQVLPILEPLPDTVTVWGFPKP